MATSPDPLSGPATPDEEELLALLAAAAVPLRAPSPSLRDRVLRTTALALVFVDRDQGIWLPQPDASVATKELYRDSTDRLTSRLVRMRKGAALPDAALSGARSLFVLSGELQGNRATVATDDCVDEGREHAPWTATADTLLLDFSSGDDGAVRTTIHPSADATWVPQTPQITIRLITQAVDPARQLIVVRAEPEATLVEHEHAGVEELYVLQGSCVVEGREMCEGDYHRALAGTSHRPTRTGAEGCVLLCSNRFLEHVRA
ncbi:MAG: cupin domain-containing protein [Gemmatimonadaceae bacterium]